MLVLCSRQSRLVAGVKTLERNKYPGRDLRQYGMYIHLPLRFMTEVPVNTFWLVDVLQLYK